MLRMGYMASDFHPKLLVLGDQDELHMVAQPLSRFAETSDGLQLGCHAGIRATGTEVQLREAGSGEAVGLFVVSNDINNVKLDWRLTREMANDFAMQISGLVHSEAKSGSATLECGRPDEIKVILSYGEWDDAFLAD